MPAVPNGERQARAARLREAGDTNRDAFLARFIGRTLDVLIETPNRGHSAEFAPVRLADDLPTSLRGSILPIEIHTLSDGQLLGHWKISEDR